MQQHIFLNDIELLPIRPVHLEHLLFLPFHHRDPFDCLLIAQSIVEQIPLISSDTIFDKYAVNRVWG